VRRWLWLGALLLACAPDFEDAPWRVEEERVLAIVSEPAEAPPNGVVSLAALVVSPHGTLAIAPSWEVCTRPRTSAERTAVTQRCLEGSALEPAASNLTVSSDACARFGPNTPPAEGDAPRQRPSDPDPSGGYFLPVRASTDAAAAFGAVRIRCDLPGVTRKTFEAFEERYIANENPVLDAVTLRGDPDALEIEVSLPPSAAEPYVRYDARLGALVEEREWLRVQWFVSHGVLDRGQETLTPQPGETARVSATWSPLMGDRSPGQGWVVVTDARGGSTWSEFSIPGG